MYDRALLDKTWDLVVEYLSNLPGRHVGARDTVESLRARLHRSLPENSEDPSSVVDFLVRECDGGIVASSGPRYFGFVTGGAIPASLAGDILATAWDQNSVLSIASPAAGVVEEVAGEWILELLGLPAGSSVGFVTGCQMANFTCLAAARHEVLKRQGWDVEKKGLFGAPQVNVLAGEEAHATIHVALRMLGFGTENVQTVPVDDQGRMAPDALEKMLHEKEGPVIICVQAGNVNTGAFDPVGEITGIARKKNAWIHVDGAFGLWGALVPTVSPRLKGFELADSWATDAHKWLNVPYDSGIAIVRHSAAHRAAMSLSAPYYIGASGEIRDPSQWVPESSRRARGFSLYACIASLGRSGISSMIEGNCRQAKLMAELLSEDPNVQILNDVVLNQVLVRFIPGSGDVDLFTRDVMRRVQQEGTCWAGRTTWKGKAAMRISVSNWATTEEDIKLSAQAVRRVLKEALDD